MNKQKIYLAPSILSADLMRMHEQVNQVTSLGADFIHVDVMDGHFVPNLTFGPNMVSALKKITSLPLDVHLMIEHPDREVEKYAKAGADILTVHQEACTHLHRCLQNIRQMGMKAGVSINPATSLTTLENVMDDIDLLLIMSVNPGFGGQTFIPQSLNKIARAHEMIAHSGHDIMLEVDGGINPSTAKKVIEHGANVLVAGHAIFGQKSLAEAMQKFKSIL